MINIEEVLSDPDFAQEYIGYRNTGTWVNGKFIDVETVINFYGPIIAASAKEIQMLPEGDRVKGLMTFYTPASNPFKISREESEEGTSDQLVWRGNRYKILTAFGYNDYGYMKAIGAKIGGV